MRTIATVKNNEAGLFGGASHLARKLASSWIANLSDTAAGSAGLSVLFFYGFEAGGFDVEQTLLMNEGKLGSRSRCLR